jgi:hypothetical protein
MIFLFTIINLYIATCPPGTTPACLKHQVRHSELYYKWKEIGNHDNYFYHPDTFGIKIARDPCAKVYLNTFTQAVNKKPCRGEWCKDSLGNTVFIGQFGKCGQGGQNCYQMEHVFDKNGCDYTSEQADIWANVVMAYGKWNSKVSHAVIGGCKNALDEKTEIYGKSMIDTIRNQINLCTRKRNNDNNTTEEPIVIDDSYNESIDGFDYNECDIACTCKSNKYLDILCGCDYSETDFDRSMCSTPQPVESQTVKAGSPV